MPPLTVKIIKGRNEQIIPCEGVTVTTLPAKGHYHDNPQIIGMPEGQVVKMILEPTGQVLYIPRHGRVIYVQNEKGDTIDTYPQKAQRGKVDENSQAEFRG